MHRWQPIPSEHENNKDNDNDNFCYKYHSCWRSDPLSKKYIFKYPNFDKCIENYEKCNLRNLHIYINNDNNELLKKIFRNGFVKCPKLTDIELTITCTFDIFSTNDSSPFKNFDEFRNIIIDWRDWILFDLNKLNKLIFGELIINEEYGTDYIEQSIQKYDTFWKIDKNNIDNISSIRKLRCLNFKPIRQIFNKNFSHKGFDDVFIHFHKMNNICQKIRLYCKLYISDCEFMNSFGLILLSEGFVTSFGDYINSVVISTLEKHNKECIQSELFENYVASKIGKEVETCNFVTSRSRKN